MLLLSQIRNLSASTCRKQVQELSKRSLSSVEVSRHQSELFSQEKKRQMEAVGRIEKIEVRYLGLPEDTTLVMNRNISTPFNCAQHISQSLCRNSALALIDGSTQWDMHRPIEDSCTLQLLNFHAQDPFVVNKAFWRTCSFLLGAALKNAFRDEADLKLHSFPSPNLRSGSFVYDFTLGQEGWKPSKQEMRVFSAEMRKLAMKELAIERLDVQENVALEVFEHNPHKREQIPSISGQNSGIITIYRVGEHVDMSRGPMVGSSSLLGKCTITAVHELAADKRGGSFYRAQGVAIPASLRLNHFAFGILEERAAKLNAARLPTEPVEAPVEAIA